MRLLNTHKLELEEFHGSNILPYAILSHTWGEGEVTFQDMRNGVAEKMAGYEKVKNTCTLATSCGYGYVWIDTCCIDKTSSAELSEAINSMFRWYEAAEISFEADGLQEDGPCKSFGSDRSHILGNTWQSIGTKTSLQANISQITGIPIDILLGGGLGNASIAQRVSWASERETTRVEDLAYSLLGIFGIHMPLVYGKGKRSFIKLQEEIMRVSDDYSLFAWRSPDSHNDILSSSVAAFTDSGNTTSNKGIHLSVPFKDLGDQKGLVVLNCTERGNDEDHACFAIRVRDVSLTKEYFERDQSETIELLDMRYLECPLRNICVKRGQPTRKREFELEEHKMEKERVIMDAMKRNKSLWKRTQTSDDGSEDAESVKDLLNTSNIEVDIVEHDEATLLRVQAKLYAKAFKAAVWKERGLGQLEIKMPWFRSKIDGQGEEVPGSFFRVGFDFEDRDSSTRPPLRLIMSENDTNRTLLNITIIHAIKFQTQRTTSFAGDSLLFTIIEDEKPISMLLKMSRPEAEFFISKIKSIQSGL